MSARRIVVLGPVVAVLLLLVPGASASSMTFSGTATSCSGLYTCDYTIVNGTVTGWARYSYTAPAGFSVELPGELNSTNSLPVTFLVSALNSTTDLINGSFVGADINNGHILQGVTSTEIVVTAHCYHTGCYDTYALVSGTITVKLTTIDGTAITFGCSPTTVAPQHATTCTATVKNLANASYYPTGKLTFKVTTSGVGSFANKGLCTLVSGTCSLKFTPSDNAIGGLGFTATYAGNSIFYKSSASTSITVSCTGGC